MFLFVVNGCCVHVANVHKYNTTVNLIGHPINICILQFAKRYLLRVTLYGFWFVDSHPNRLNFHRQKDIIIMRRFYRKNHSILMSCWLFVADWLPPLYCRGLIRKPFFSPFVQSVCDYKSHRQQWFITFNWDRRFMAADNAARLHT